jgi:hypothetical protein
MTQREFKHGVPELLEVKASPRAKKIYGFFNNPLVIIGVCATILTALILWRGGHAVSWMQPHM